MIVNVKRGFNRLFVVLTVLWAGYCLFVFPMQRQNDARAVQLYISQSRVCYDIQSANPTLRKDCLDGVEKMYQSDIAPWQWKNYYQSKWMYILAALILVPLAVYGACRAAGLAFVWVARGFRA